MEPFLRDPDVTVYCGDALEVLRELPAESVDMCVTSPPYWGLRDYGIDNQLGLEPTPDQYVQNMVAVFREVYRVLKPWGTCWVNLGDSYAANRSYQVSQSKYLAHDFADSNAMRVPDGLKPKDLVGIPWRVAFALQADGWYLRSDIIWSKPNPMPESVTDRPTKAHEYVFLLAKQPRYFFDQEAVREPHSPDGRRETTRPIGPHTHDNHQRGNGERPERWPNDGRNIRSVWTIATKPYPQAHFATYPVALAERCILAGTSDRGVCPACGKPWERETEREPTEVKAPGSAYGHGAGRNDGGRSGLVGASTTTLGWRPTCDCGRPDTRPAVVLDPFGGAGTSAVAARKHGRRTILVELNADYCDLIARRLAQQSLLTELASPQLIQEPLVDVQTTHRRQTLTGGAYSPPGQSPHSNARRPAGQRD